MQSQLKKPLLYAAVISVVLSALLGIVIVLRGEWGWIEIRVILTTVILAVSSLCGLASDLARTPKGLNLLPRFGLGLTALSTLLLLSGVWVEVDSEAYWKLTAITCTFAIATVHVALLSIAKLARRFRWVYLAACQIVFGLAILIGFLILSEESSELIWRFLAAHSIVAAAVSFVIPILHRISRTDANRGELFTPLEMRNIEAIDNRIAELEDALARLRDLREKVLGDESKMSPSNPSGA